MRQMRALILFLVIWGAISALIFGYKYITKTDKKVAGKLTVAAVVAAILSVMIYLGEYN